LGIIIRVSGFESLLRHPHIAPISALPREIHEVALSACRNHQAVIDTVLPFTQIVDAHRRVDSGRKVGSLVLAL
jgi:hypothetical protein